MLPEKNRRQLRMIIEQELEKLESSLESLRDQTQPIPPDGTMGRLSRIESMAQMETAENLLARASRRREQLRAQLEKMNSPDYGICARCHQPIPLERLKAVPDAVMCVPCIEAATRRR